MKFKELVKMSGNNYQKLEVKTGLKQPYLSTIDNRDYELMTLRNAKKIADEIGLTLDEFYNTLTNDSYGSYLEVWYKYRKKGEVPLTEQEWKLK